MLGEAVEPPQEQARARASSSEPDESYNGDGTEDEEDKNEEEDLHEEENLFFGIKPATEKDDKIKLSSDPMESLKTWMTKGLAEEDKKKLLEETPRKGDLSFEAPVLNEEVIIGMNDLAIKRDKFFMEHQNMAGAILSSVSSVAQLILNDKEVPIVRKEILGKLSNAVKMAATLFHDLSETRKAFITPGFEKSFRSALEKTTAGDFLFGNKLQDVISGTETMVKVSKQIRPRKDKKPLKPAQSLNWKSSDEKVDRPNRKRARSPSHASATKKPKRPQGRQYAQSQPIQQQGRHSSSSGSKHR